MRAGATDTLVLPILVQVRMRYSVTPPIGSTSLWCSVWSRSRVDSEDSVLSEEAQLIAGDVFLIRRLVERRDRWLDIFETKTFDLHVNSVHRYSLRRPDHLNLLRLQSRGLQSEAIENPCG